MILHQVIVASFMRKRTQWPRLLTAPATTTAREAVSDGWHAVANRLQVLMQICMMAKCRASVQREHERLHETASKP